MAVFIFFAKTKRVSKIRNILQLVRFKNLIILAGTQLMCYFHIIKWVPENQHLRLLPLLLLLLSTLFSAAAGNVINDLFDQGSDTVDKPSRAERTVKIGAQNILKTYLILLFLALITAGVFDYTLSVLWLSIYQLILSPLLFLYSYRLKRWLLIGNLSVAGLCALSLAIVAFAFDIQNSTEANYGQVFWYYVGLAFLMTFFREIVKDIEDIEGDRAVGCKTLPIVLGTQAAVWIAVIPLMGAAFLNLALLSVPRIAIPAMLLFVVQLAIAYRLFKARDKGQFHSISQWTKWMMLPAMLLLL